MISCFVCDKQTVCYEHHNLQVCERCGNATEDYKKVFLNR